MFLFPFGGICNRFLEGESPGMNIFHPPPKLWDVKFRGLENSPQLSATSLTKKNSYKLHLVRFQHISEGNQRTSVSPKTLKWDIIYMRQHIFQHGNWKLSMSLAYDMEELLFGTFNTQVWSGMSGPHHSWVPCGSWEKGRVVFSCRLGEQSMKTLMRWFSSGVSDIPHKITETFRTAGHCCRHIQEWKKIWKFSRTIHVSHGHKIACITLWKAFWAWK